MMIDSHLLPLLVNSDNSWCWWQAIAGGTLTLVTRLRWTLHNRPRPLHKLVIINRHHLLQALDYQLHNQLHNQLHKLIIINRHHLLQALDFFEVSAAQSSEVRFPTHKGTNEECDDIVLLVVICNFALTNLSNGHFHLQSNSLKKRKLIIQIKLWLISNLKGSNDDSSKIPLPTGLWVLNNALAGPTVYLPGPHYDDDGQTQLKNKLQLFWDLTWAFSSPLFGLSAVKNLSPPSCFPSHPHLELTGSRGHETRNFRGFARRGFTASEDWLRPK